MNPADTATDDAGRQYQKLFEEFTRRLGRTATADDGDFFRGMIDALVADPGRWADIQQRHYTAHLELWHSFFDADGKPAGDSTATDRRFGAPDWHTTPYFDYLHQAYLLNIRWLSELVEQAVLAPRDKTRLRFLTGRFADAMSPANFPFTNPEALRLAFETGGASIAQGLRNFAADLAQGRISTNDETAFRIGRNLAVTPGAVIFENELMQLIQYRPLTDTVFERPLLIVPPCINKFYILDLRPDNSFVRHALAHGHTVFMISWRNIPPALGHLTWDDYVERGVLRAIDAACDICGVTQVNTLGFCIGGTLLATALAVSHERHPQASLTLLATMTDFRDGGELGAFVDEAWVADCERQFRDGGIFRGEQLALAFASLRANDLVWRYVVNNYLKGLKPAAFDLLYWNSDSTDLPGPMFAYYLRNMYLENNLRVPGKLTTCGVPVDLSRLAIPVYAVAASDDHIVPWRSAYASARLLPGAVRFVLAASGHVAGIINPAGGARRSYRTAPDGLPENPDSWFAASASQPGSWWTDWSAWSAAHGGRRVAARSTLGNARHPEIEPAPGRYVTENHPRQP
jgi:polyhydroxyalkanoate synthase